MATVMTMQLNNQENYGYFARIPRVLYRKGYTPSAIDVFGQIFSHSGESEQGVAEKYCRLSYHQAKDKLSVTTPTVNAALHVLKEQGEIEIVMRDKNGTGYKCVGNYDGKKYDVAPEYLYTAKFMIDGEMRLLKPSERRVLIHILTLAEYKKNGGAAEGSARIFARTLNLSEKTVREAIRVLLRNGLMYRHEEDKGINKYKLSKYRTNKKLYEYKKSQKKRAEKGQEQQLPAHVQAANMRAARERYYALQQEQNRQRAEKYINRAMENTRYAQIDAEIRKMQPSLAFAELKNQELFLTLEKKEKALRIERAAILAQMKIRPEWLKAEHFCACKACKDTGTLPNGRMCDCYKKE